MENGDPVPRTGAPVAVPEDLVDLGGSAYLAGDLATAAACWIEAAALLRSSGRFAALSGLLCNLGGLQYGRGRYAEALAALDEARDLLPSADADPALALRIPGNRGLALLALKRTDEARADLDEAFRLALAAGAWDVAARHAAVLSRLAQAAGDREGALRHHVACMELERDHGVTVPPPHAPVRDSAQPSDPAAVPAHRVVRSSRTDGPVVIFAPPMEGHHGPIFPRGAASIATFLSARGIPACVVPMSHALGPGASASPQDRDRIQEDAVRDVLDSLRPRAVGITIPFSHVYPDGLDLARTVRRLDGEVPIAAGGPHVTYQDEACLAEAPGIDVVVRGEGEWTFLDLLHAWQVGGNLADVAGITWRTPRGAIRRNPSRPVGDVRALPDIDFSLLPRDFCRRMEVTGITGRGCLYRCAYCQEFRFWGGVQRQHPVATVAGELDRLAREYGNRTIAIDDSMLDLRAPYFVDLCRALAAGGNLDDTFQLLTRIDTVSADGLRALRDAGIRRIATGLESGSDRVLAAMNKGTSVAVLRAGLETIARAGVLVTAYLMAGHPGDDAHESDVTERFVDRQLADGLVAWLDPAMFVPYPGTPFYAHPERSGIEILIRDWSQWNRTAWPVAQLRDFPAAGIRLAYLRLLALEERHARARICVSGL